MEGDVVLLADAHPLTNELHREVHVDDPVGLGIDVERARPDRPVDRVRLGDLLVNRRVIEVVHMDRHHDPARLDTLLDPWRCAARDDVDALNGRIGERRLENPVARRSTGAEDRDCLERGRGIRQHRDFFVADDHPDRNCDIEQREGNNGDEQQRSESWQRHADSIAAAPTAKRQHAL